MNSRVSPTDRLVNDGQTSESFSYDKYLIERKYPELFRQVQRDLRNDRGALVDFVKPLLVPATRNPGSLYRLICSWPFACYLTTNFDDEIYSHIKKYNEPFSVIRNRKEDFYHWRDGATNIIQKLHSDLSHPDEVILTSTDYQRIYSSASGSHYRNRLCTIFSMFDVLIVGHSLADPDLRWVLEVAKEMRSLSRPIYMVAAGFSTADESELLEKYNIVLVSYANPEGDHSELRRLLKTVDRYIVHRDQLGHIRVVDNRPAAEVEAAVAIYLYRHLQGIDERLYLSPLILSGLHSSGEREVAMTDVTSLPVLANLSHGQAMWGDAIGECIDDLRGHGLVRVSGDRVEITDRGTEKVQEYQTLRSAERDQAYGRFRMRVQELYPRTTDSQLDRLQELSEQAIVASFASRGTMVANKVFSDQSARPEELTDVFGRVSDRAAQIEDTDLRLAFLDALHEFLVEPTPGQKKYLASISQGYFLYQLLGLDPTWGAARRAIFQRTLWLCDSSVVLPLLAKGCHLHDYTVELFEMFHDERALIATTRKLLQEAWEHLEWARRLVERFGAASLEFQRAATVGGSYRQNLFIDGYINLNATGEIGTFSDYLELIHSNSIVNQRAFEENLTRHGLRIIDISILDGFVQDDWGDVEAAKGRIQIAREERGIYRAPLQVESEAEVWVLVKNLRSKRYSVEGVTDPERVYFVSQSRIIDRVFGEEVVTTWTPETVFRYMASLPGKRIDADILQQCMLGEYFYAGISFIDKDRYEQFFSNRIDAAKASYEKQREGYIKDLEESAAAQIDEAFASTRDIEKPFFVAQMGWQMVDAAERSSRAAISRALGAEARVRELEAERDKGWRRGAKGTEAQDAARLRNLQDPKHVRKRWRQAKKRRRRRR